MYEEEDDDDGKDDESNPADGDDFDSTIGFDS